MPKPKRKKWLNIKKHDSKSYTMTTDHARRPFGADTLLNSTDTAYGTHPKSEVTQPSPIYQEDSSYRADHSNTFPGREQGVWPISTSQKKTRWLLKHV